MIKRKEANTMQQILTAKIRLYPTNEQIVSFKAITKEYQRLCNIVSQWYFDGHFNANQKVFQKDMYRYLRNESPNLNSQMVQSTYRTVKARYDTVRTQLYQRPYRYDTEVIDEKTGRHIWKSVPRTLDWLWKPIHFKRPQADYVHGSNYSFVKNRTMISLNILGKRIKVPFKADYLAYLFSANAKLGTAKLVQLKKHWFLHVPVTIEVSEWKQLRNQHIVGIDRGLRQIMTIYDEKGKTKFFNGKQVAHRRKKYAYLRKRLQSANTKSAKRHLKRLAGRENRWMEDVNHRLPKTLVQHYGANTLFVLEDLTNVSFDEKNQGTRDRNRDLHSWSFYDLQVKLTYKSQANQSQVLIVSAKYTSQRCPKCGQICKENRNHALHRYDCAYCGFKTNDDRVGAMNLYELGKQYLTGNEHPKFELNNVTD